tara:strand:- start:176 stop:355 length:180 start_codon:yes stop_codon:yes gene_type:complete
VLRDLELSELDEPKKNLFDWELERSKLYTLGDHLWLEDISNVIIVVARKCKFQHGCPVS